MACQAQNNLPRFTYRAKHRLKSSVDFQATFKARMSVSDGKIVLYGRPNDLSHCRLGLSVGRKFGNAVARNRFKRLIREAFRLHHHQWGRPCDFIVIPRQPRLDSYAAYEKSLCSLVKRLQKRIDKAAASQSSS